MKIDFSQVQFVVEGPQEPAPNTGDRTASTGGGGVRRIALMNQKGGVGKTTSTVNLGAALARAGRSVCLIDLDPQAHSTTHLGVELEAERPTIYDVLVRGLALADARIQLEPNLSLIPSHLDLAAAEVELAGEVGREMLLRDQLQHDAQPFDYFLIDCPPSLGILTVNALTAVDEVFVPLQPHFLALHGLSKLFGTVELVRKRLNPQLKISGVIMCLYESGTRLSAEITNDVEASLEQARGSGKPWAEARVFHSRIRRNVRIAEAASFGKTIFDYAHSSPGARDYQLLAEEVLAQEPRPVGLDSARTPNPANATEPLVAEPTPKEPAVALAGQ